eukprot:3308032-Pleurochrysis_carterae.AAC.1
MASEGFLRKAVRSVVAPLVDDEDTSAQNFRGKQRKMAGKSFGASVRAKERSMDALVDGGGGGACSRGCRAGTEEAM